MACHLAMESATHQQSEPPTLVSGEVESRSDIGPDSTSSSNGRVSWFEKLTIEQRILAGFSLVFVGILVITAVSYHNTSIVLTNSRLDGRSHDLLQLLSTIDVAMNEAEDAHRRYLVSSRTERSGSGRTERAQRDGVFPDRPRSQRRLDPDRNLSTADDGCRSAGRCSCFAQADQRSK